MVDISRRRLLAVGSAVALTGCMGGTDTDAATTDGGGAPATSTAAETPDGSGAAAGAAPSPVPAAIQTALAPVPTSVDGRALGEVRLARPADVPEDDSIAANVRALDIAPADTDYAVVASYDEGSIGVLTGEFDADSPDTTDADGTFSREDGLLVGARHPENESWETGLDAATAAVDDPSARLLSEDTVGEALSVVAEYPVVSYRPFGDSAGGTSEDTPDPIGFVSASEEIEGSTERAAYVYPDADTAEEVPLSELFGGDHSDVTVTREGAFIVVEPESGETNGDTQTVEGTTASGPAEE